MNLNKKEKYMMGMFLFLHFLVITTVKIILITLNVTVRTTAIIIKIIMGVGNFLKLFTFGVPIRSHAYARRSARPRSHNPRQSLGYNKY